MKTLVRNARIYSMDKNGSTYDTMLIQGNKIALLGNYKNIKKQVSDIDKVWDLGGKVVIPGMTDSHLHFLDYSLSLEEVSLRGADSIDTCKDIIKEKVKTLEEGEWLTGGGWDKNLWGGNLPTKEIIDEVAPNNPVFLISKDCHTSWVNSMALKEAGVNSETTIEGGEVEKSGNTLTGILKENAQSLVRRSIPYPSAKIIKDMLLKAIHNAHSLGYTAVHTMSLQNDTSFYTLLDGLKEIKKENRLSLKFVLNPTLKIMKDLIESGLDKDFDSRFIRLGAVKIFVDGSLGSQSAWTLKEYCGSKKHRGMPIEYGEVLEDSVKESILLGYPVAVHAIGDKANKEILNVLSKYSSISQRLRHRIEHAQLLDPSDIKRFADLGVIASVQPIHLSEDICLIEEHWGAGGRWAYPFNSLLKNKAVLTFGSDSPVEDINPFIGMHVAVNRQRKDNKGYFYENEKISVYDAVKAYTWAPAYASNEENKRGTLEVGKLADFVVIDRDIFNIDENEIADINVELTVVEGDIVYNHK